MKVLGSVEQEVPNVNFSPRCFPGLTTTGCKIELKIWHNALNATVIKEPNYFIKCYDPIGYVRNMTPRFSQPWIGHFV